MSAEDAWEAMVRAIAESPMMEAVFRWVRYEGPDYTSWNVAEALLRAALGATYSERCETCGGTGWLATDIVIQQAPPHLTNDLQRCPNCPSPRWAAVHALLGKQLDGSWNPLTRSVEYIELPVEEHQ